MNKEKIVIVLERLRERKIELEDAIFEIEELLEEDNRIIQELESLEEDDESFEIEVQRLVSIVEDSEIKYRKASYKDIKKLVNNSSLEELDRLIRDLRDE